jgi:hypothetical protein
MRTSERAITKTGAAAAIFVMCMLVVGIGIIFFPGRLFPPRSTQSIHSTAASSQSAHSGSLSSSSPTSSSCPGLWPYPSTFNETLVLDNSTLVYPASTTAAIPLPAGQSLYLGFRLVDQAQISGSLASSGPINLSIIANSNGGPVFPMGSNDKTVFSNTNASAISFALPSPISGDIGPGNYAIVFTNNGASQANVTVEQGIQVSYYHC